MPWLTAEPTSGLISPTEVVIVQITLDAGRPAIDQPGLYTGTLGVDYSSPYGSIDVGVSFNVVALPKVPFSYFPLFNQHEN